MACAEVDGIPVALSGGDDGTVRVWDLRTGDPIGEPLTGHTRSVQAVACTVVDEVPVAVSGGDDGTVRVWNLRTRTFEVVRGLTNSLAMAITPRGDPVVGCRDDLAVFRRQAQSTS